MKYYTTSDNLKLDLQNGDIDVAYRTLSPTDIEDLKGDSDVSVLTGSGGELQRGGRRTLYGNFFNARLRAAEQGRYPLLAPQHRRCGVE